MRGVCSLGEYGCCLSVLAFSVSRCGSLARDALRAYSVLEYWNVCTMVQMWRLHFATPDSVWMCGHVSEGCVPVEELVQMAAEKDHFIPGPRVPAPGSSASGTLESVLIT